MKKITKEQLEILQLAMRNHPNIVESLLKYYQIEKLKDLPYDRFIETYTKIHIIIDHLRSAENKNDLF